MSYLFSKRGALRALRPYQERALEALRRSIGSGHKRVIVPAPTGFGKTMLAAHIAAGALNKNNSVIFCVPALSLIDQTVAAFEAEGITYIGVVQGSHPRTDPSQPIQICSVQTLARREKPDGAVVIIDECHRAFKAVHDWMADPAWADAIFIGLSATPWTRGLGKHWDDLIVTARTRELIDAGFLSDFVVFAPGKPDLSAVRTVAGDFHEGDLASACDKPGLIGDVVATWLERGEDRPTLCYGVNRAHAEHLQQRFVEAGISAEYMDGHTDRVDREAIFRGFRAGLTRIICNVGVLTTGFDADVRCIIDAKPTKSEMLFVQTIGRGLRTAEGKDKLTILDHAGNHLRLGMVTDIHHDRLDDGGPRGRGRQEPQERTTPLPRLCGACKAVIPRQATRCSECGAIREAKSGVEIRDGELVELGSRAKAKAAPTIVEQSAFYAELCWIALERRYASGWTAHKFRERFGAWPNDWRVKNALPSPPSLKTKQWILSRRIAWAKARANG